jgi:hypothetical protein
MLREGLNELNIFRRQRHQTTSAEVVTDLRNPLVIG